MLGRAFGRPGGAARRRTGLGMDEAWWQTMQ